MSKIYNSGSGMQFTSLISNIKSMLRNARHNAFYAVNTEMLKAYFEIGKKIFEEEQKGGQRAAYGEKLLEKLSEELKKEFGKGFGTIAIKNMRIFYKTYENKISQSVTG